MKKMTFALACASAVAAFAAWEAPVLNAIGFDEYTKVPFTGLSNKTDNGSEPTAAGDSFWLYVGASGSEDGSTVKAYDPEKTGNPNYLELSTEGGTLWRSISGLSSATELGEAQEVPADGLYIDTMVQFTPTEDGGAPETDGADKLAIWLNVDSSGATNLMVKASQLYTEGTDEAQHTLSTNAVYVVSNPEVEIQAGEWHRLTVKAVKNILNVPSTVGRQEYVSAFEIRIGGKVMAVTGEKVATDDFIAFYSKNEDAGLPDCFATGAAAALQAGTLIPSLKGYTEYNDQSALQAVGFKGSGAIDSLSISETAPSPAPEDPTPVTPEITLSATEATFSDSLQLPTVTVAGNYVLSTDYTVSWDKELPTENPSEDVVLTVTVKMCGKYSGSSTATFTVKPASTPPVVNDWPSDPTTMKGQTAGAAYGFTGDLAGVPADKLAAWAKGNGKVAFSDAGTIKMDAYLLNCENTDAAITAAKANFKIVSIEQNAQGAWVAKVTDNTGDGEAFGNGYVVIKGSATVNGTYNLATTAEAARFFKAFLVLEAPTTK